MSSPEKKSENLDDFRNKLTRFQTVGSDDAMWLGENMQCGGYQLRLKFGQSQSGTEDESTGFSEMKSGSVFGYFACVKRYFRGLFIKAITPQSLGTNIIV